jgi:16S rRNA (guanine527-N7)-methyltransferase
MEKDTFIFQITEGTDAMGITLTEEAVSRLFIYHSELEKWNKKINLVSRQQSDWVRVHFLDSLAPIGLGLVSGSERVVDLGAGAGFPGVPLKVARVGLKLGLAEASEKKCVWLNHLVRTLGIEDAEVLGGRFEELLEKERSGQYDLVVSRAAAKPKGILKLASRFLAPGGRTLIYTTRALVDEGVGKVHPYKVPGSKVPSVIWEVKK